MKVFLKGEVSSVQPNYIVIDHNGCGIMIHVPNPGAFSIGEHVKIHTHVECSIRAAANQISETWYGFKEWDDRQFFGELLRVPGIGCKTAIAICSYGTLKAREAITGAGSAEELAAVLAIKVSQAHGLIGKPSDAPDNSGVTKALEALGYTRTQIAFALGRISRGVLAGEDGLSVAIREIALHQSA